MGEINTKQIVLEWKEELKERISKLESKAKLNIIQIGDNEASNKYINNKLKVAEELGICTNYLKLEENISQDKLERIIYHCGKTPTILQLPVPKHINVDEVMLNLNPSTDVDGFTRTQKAMLVDGDKETLVPATALGIIRMLKSVVGDLTGKKVAIVNRSHLIGKPLIQLLLQENAYPVVLHSRVSKENMACEMASSDIVITGCGQRAIFNADNFRNGQLIIDCSMDRVNGVKGVGDIDKEDVLDYLDVKIASGYGHTGLATVVALMENVIKAYENRSKKEE